MAMRSRILRDGGASRGSEAAALGSGGDGEGLEVELLVELAGAGLDGGIEQLAGHGHQDAIVAGGVLDERGDEFVSHELEVAGLNEGVAQALAEFLGRGGGPSPADAGATA